MIDLLISPHHKTYLEMLLGCYISDAEYRKLVKKATRIVNDAAVWTPGEDQETFNTAMRHSMAMLYYGANSFMYNTYKQAFDHTIRAQEHKVSAQYEDLGDDNGEAAPWWEEPTRFTVVTAIFLSGAYLVSLV